MEICFSIHYHTQWGETLLICGNAEELGSGDPKAAPSLTYQGEGCWEVRISFSAETLKEGLSYSYWLVNERTGEVQHEGGTPRWVHLETHEEAGGLLQVVDHWQGQDNVSRILDGRAFAQYMFDAPATGNAPFSLQGQDAVPVYFTVKAQRLAHGYHLCVVGDIPELGAWDPSQALPLTPVSGYAFGLSVHLPGDTPSFEYKYAIWDENKNQMVEWETGENRRFDFPGSEDTGSFWVNDPPFRYQQTWKGAGVAIPVFSLRTQQGMGVGEFLDLKEMVNWAAQAGLRMVQILPVNDTMATHTWWDSYPYAGVSVYALHPLYVNLDSLFGYYGEPMPESLAGTRAQLNQLATVDYEAVMETKLKSTRAFFDRFQERIFVDADFQIFVEENSHWLHDYGVFSCLRDHFHTPDFNQWDACKEYSPDLVQRLIQTEGEGRSTIYYYFFLQYHLHLQLKAVADYARVHKVLLKGDIPIGIYRYSVDAWTQPHLFHMEMQAGAPPDFFSRSGQNWGFPTYHWEAMARDGYQWWRNRLSHMAQYFDAYRIDHILGFFRIWAIPYENIEGVRGYFQPGLPFSKEELHQWHLPFDHERMSEPFLPADQVQRGLGDWASWAKTHLLEEKYPGFFRFRPEVASQRKLEAYLNAQSSLSVEERDQVRQGAFSLINEVLFIEDTSRPGYYHPRFALQFTSSYAALPDWAKDRMNWVYNHYYFHRHEEFWKEQASIKLPAILNAADMLACGEDLGFVPSTVPEVMDKMGILSLEIQRMSKDSRQEFSHPAHAPYLSVVSTSTHDLAPIRAWWEEDRERTQRFFNHQLGQAGPAPYFCEPWIGKLILEQHLNSPAMWVVLPIQDWLMMDGDLRRRVPTDEQINDPANPHHYWRYRMHIPLSELHAAQNFNESLETLIRTSGRNLAY